MIGNSHCQSRNRRELNTRPGRKIDKAMFGLIRPLEEPMSEVGDFLGAVSKDTRGIAGIRHPESTGIKIQTRGMLSDILQQAIIVVEPKDLKRIRGEVKDALCPDGRLPLEIPTYDLVPRITGRNKNIVSLMPRPKSDSYRQLEDEFFTARNAVARRLGLDSDDLKGQRYVPRFEVAETKRPEDSDRVRRVMSNMMNVLPFVVTLSPIEEYLATKKHVA